MHWENLDLLSNQRDASQDLRAMNVGTATALTGAATLGYVIWTIRSSQMLMATLLASGPSWGVWDPMPILAFASRSREDDSSLADLAKESNLPDGPRQPAN